MNFSVKSVVLVCIGILLAGAGFDASAEIDPDTVVGLWLFDEGNGKVVSDASGNGLDGEFEGKPKWVQGKFGEGLELDGQGAYVKIPDHENHKRRLLSPSG